MSQERRVEQHLAIVTQQASSVVLSALGEGRSSATLERAMAMLLSYEEQTKQALVQALARDPKLLPVCAPGCAFCCHLSVFASVPEILFIAAHLRGALSGAALAVRRAEVVAAADVVAELTQAERAASKRVCPLLDPVTRSCSIYEARPLLCRAYNSCDAGACERAFEEAQTHWEMPVDLFQRSVSRNVRTGLMAALTMVGLDPGPYELSAGLAVALTEPNAAARWLSGEPIFAAAETRIGRERRPEWRANIARAAAGLRT